MSNLLWMIVGMGIVTYIPRMLPLVSFKHEAIPRFLQNVLRNVPFAVLGALIFPGLFIIDSGSIQHIDTSGFIFGLFGGLTAFLTAYIGWNIVLVVLSAIGVLTVYSLLV